MITMRSSSIEELEQTAVILSLLLAFARKQQAKDLALRFFALCWAQNDEHGVAFA